MRKLRLSLDELAVDSFETKAGSADPRGTVRGLEVTAPTPCGDTEDMWVCQSFESCPPSHPYQKICM
ncbi:MAG TPA: hypothetical protein VFX98_10915 [Longimicrobiaceae bacterium]|nr:hypothetical protein [Longimicrobiaceae bacterium]